MLTTLYYLVIAGVLLTPLCVLLALAVKTRLTINVRLRREREGRR